MLERNRLGHFLALREGTDVFLESGSVLLFAAASTTLLFGVSSKVGAQDAVLEEVVVTARRYEETVSDAPLAVNVMSSDYMRNQQITTIQDIIELTPGATWEEFTKAQPSFSMRGIDAVSHGNSSIETGVQLVIDGIAQTKAFMMSPPVFDLERVEIMRGPQGTTFGRNATIGLLHFITARPTQEFEAAFDLQAGELDMFGVDGFISGPLTDTVSGRIAARVYESDGALEHTVTGEPLEGYSNESIRASLLIEPSDTFSAYLKFEYNHDDDLPVARKGESCTIPWLTSPPYMNEYTDPGTCKPWKAIQSIDPPGGFETERDMYSLTGEFTWAVRNDITITSLTGYQDGEHHTLQDVLGSPEVLGDQDVINDAKVLSTELRIDNSASGDAFRWLGGIYLLADEEYRREENIGCPPRGMGCGQINPLPTSHLINIGDAETASLGLFGELSFDLSERWNLTIGGRYSDDSRDYAYQVIGWGRATGLIAVGLVDDPNGNGTVDPGEFDGDLARDCALNTVMGICGTEAFPMGIVDPVPVTGDFDDFSGKVSLGYAINDNNNVYFLYSEGFKAGGFQHDARNLKALLAFLVEDEKAENFEIGWKGSYDTARFAVTLFDMEQANAQANAAIPVGSGFTSSLTNFGGVETTGLEFEGTWLATDNLLIGGNFALYDGELGPGSVINAGFDPATGQVTGTDVSGVRSGMDESYVFWGEYGFALARGSTITLRADWQHRSDLPGDPALRGLTTLDGSMPGFGRPEVDNVGALIRWTSPSGQTAATLWGKNLMDEYDWTSIGPGICAFFAQPASQNGMGPCNAPRSYGGRKQVGLTASFSF